MTLYKPVIVKKEVDNEHYYYVNDKFVPSVTKILGETMPMPYALRKWIGDVGNEKADMKLEQAGDRGSRIHQACELLLCGGEVRLHEEFPERRDQKCIASFIDWVNEYQPRYEKFDIELVVASQLGYAGTLDWFCYIKDEPYIVDLKTSAGIYDSHKLQITAYQHAYEEMTGIKAKRGILHLNPLLKRGYSFIDDDKMTIEDKNITVDDYLKVFEMYKMLNGGVVPEPKLIDVYPEKVSLIADKVKTDS
jgi:CRISPR/Cas system-associated exonuclease Cas4 (RecB family)